MLLGRAVSCEAVIEHIYALPGLYVVTMAAFCGNNIVDYVRAKVSIVVFLMSYDIISEAGYDHKPPGLEY